MKQYTSRLHLVGDLVGVYKQTVSCPVRLNPGFNTRAANSTFTA